MSIFEYDAEKHLRLEREESYEEGREEGRDRMLLLLNRMERNNELHLISKLQDTEFLEQMYAKYQV